MGWPVTWPDWTRSLGFFVPFFSVPLVLCLAFREWRRALKPNLPFWRSYLGITSMILSASNWFFYPLLAASMLMGFRSEILHGDVIDSLPSFGVASAMLGLAFKGRSRMLAILAGFLLIVMRSSTVVV